MIAAWVAAAHADPAGPPAEPPDPVPAEPADPAPGPPPEPAPILLDAGGEVLPSALDGLEAARDETPELALDALLPDWVPVTKERLRGQLFVRPLAALVVLPSEGTAVRLGGAVGHRWWTLKPSTVDWGGEERGWVAAPVGGVSGYGVGGQVVGGPWIGPVGLRVGPTLRADRADFGDGVVLRGATAVGASADLALALGSLTVTGGAEPAWLVSGDRTPAADGAPGDEWTWRAGFGWQGRPLQWALDGEARATAVGTVWSGGLSLQVRLW